MIPRLIISDVDSTLIRNEVIDLIADFAGKGAEVSKITERAMTGELDFKNALMERVSLLAGLEIEILDEVAKKIELSPGALELRDYCRKTQIPFGAVTGGFREVLEKVSFFCHLDYLAANSLEIVDGKLTGRTSGEIIDRSAKADHLQKFADQMSIPVKASIAIGDGANDIEMIQRAGIGIGYRPKSALREVADLVIEESLVEVINFMERQKLD